MPTLHVSSPLRGVNTVVNREGQSPDTCWSATNMLPYDRFGRRRIAQRPGLVKQFATQLGTSMIQGMLPINNITYAGSIGGGGVSTLIGPFFDVPAGITTSSNTITWPGSSTGYTPDLADTGPTGFPGTVPDAGCEILFDVTLTGPSTGGSSFLWVALNDTAHTFQNITSSSRLTYSFTLDPTNTGDVQIQGFTSTHAPSTYNLWITDSPPANPPVSGTPFSVTLNWASTGDILPSIDGTTNFFDPPDTLNVASGLGPPAGAVTFFAELANSTSLSISNLRMVTGGSATPTGSIAYETLLLAVCEGYVWIGKSDGTIAKAANGQSTPLISSTNIVSMAFCQGIVFITDGTRMVTYTVATDTVAVATAVPSPGNITGTVPPNCSLICNWRGRIVLAGDSNNPQNYYMSRVPGTYFNTVTSTNVVIGPGADWDYSQDDGAQAVAGNLNTGLQIGEPIVALMPFSNDYLKIGCSHSLWMYQGDPAVGGNLVNVSNEMGVVGKDAWTIDPSGTLWFAATGGLFSVRPAWEIYRPPEPVSLQSVNQAFRNLSPGEERVVLLYDPDLHYLHTFGSPMLQGAATHLTMDARSIGKDGPPGFWPQIFPDACGPVCACTYFSDGNPNNRAILLGGFDGYIRSWSDTATDDDGTATSAGVTLGPFAPVQDEAATLIGTTINMGELPPGYSSTTNWNVNVILAAGPDAYSVTEGLNTSANGHPIPHINGLTLDRRQKTFRQRLRGGWFTISLQNLTGNSFFSFESAALEFTASGHNRLRR